MDEEQRRQRAIELLAQGRRPGDVLRELGRSREWLAKWCRRFEEAGAAGLRGLARTPVPSTIHAPVHRPSGASRA